MKRTIGALVAVALMTGAGFAQAGRSGGGHGGGARASAVAARPASGGFTRFTTGPMQFTTGPHWRPPIVGRPPVIGRPIPLPPRPVVPIHNHPAVVGGGTVIVTAPIWYPAYPYPYVAPVYGGAYAGPVPTYSDAPAYSYNPDAPSYQDSQGYTERDDYWYYCPDSQTYYPYVSTCPSPWVKVLPEPTDSQTPQ